MFEMPPVPVQTRSFTGSELQGTNLGVEQGGIQHGILRTTNDVKAALGKLSTAELAAARKIAAQARPEIIPLIDAEAAARSGVRPPPKP